MYYWIRFRLWLAGVKNPTRILGHDWDNRELGKLGIVEVRWINKRGTEYFAMFNVYSGRKAEKVAARLKFAFEKKDK